MGWSQLPLLSLGILCAFECSPPSHYFLPHALPPTYFFFLSLSHCLTLTLCPGCPTRRGSEDEWDMTPAVPGGNRTPSTLAGGTGGGGGTGAGTRRSSGASAWTSGNDTPLPAAAVPGGGGAVQPYRGSSAAPSRVGPGAPGRVQFDMAPSPALTPTWKSTSWNRSALGAKVGGTGGTAGGTAGGEDVERSPELRPGGGEQGQDFDEQVEGKERGKGRGRGQEGRGQTGKDETSQIAAEGPMIVTRPLPPCTLPT